MNFGGQSLTESNKKMYEQEFSSYNQSGTIYKSRELFKIKLFIDKAKNSIKIAKYIKDIKPDNEQPKKLHWNYWAITISYYAMLYAGKAAILSKGYEVNDHKATTVALGYLFVPNKIEKEDLELLNQSHKIFEEEYITYFKDAQSESHTARYTAIQTYEERRLNQIFENATKFIGKITLMLQDQKNNDDNIFLHNSVTFIKTPLFEILYA